MIHICSSVTNANVISVLFWINEGLLKWYHRLFHWLILCFASFSWLLGAVSWWCLASALLAFLLTAQANRSLVSPSFAKVVQTIKCSGCFGVQRKCRLCILQREDSSRWKQAAQRKAAFISPFELWGLTGVWPQWLMLTPRLQRAES